MHNFCMLAFLIAALSLTRPVIAAPPETGSPATGAKAFINGLWYDGKAFREKTFYVVEGKLTQRKPAVIAETVDLKGGYVVPPLADAHCHHFDSIGMVNRLVPQYLKDGVFYAQSMTNYISGRKIVAGMVNKPDSIDVAYADAGLTCTLGHGVEVYEPLAHGMYGYVSPKEFREKIGDDRKAENNAYYIVDNRELLDAVWKRIEQGPPDLIKVYLLHSEIRAALVAGDGIGDKGIDPALLPEITRRAHRLHLPVYAHVESVFDFRAGLDAGIDGFAHLPGYAFPLDTENPQLYRLTEDDAKRTGRQKVIVQPTVWLAIGYAGKDAVKLEKAKDLQRENLRLLKKYGVRFALGSDSYGSGPWGEAEYLNALGIFERGELLKIWTETTVQTIFPKRRVGRLADGYEASFLVLDKNPLDDLQNLKTIRYRLKQGVALTELGD